MAIILFEMVKELVNKDNEEKEVPAVRDQLINISRISPELADKILVKYPTVDAIKAAITDRTFAENIDGIGHFMRNVLRKRLKAPKDEVVPEEPPAEDPKPDEPAPEVPDDTNQEKGDDNMAKKTGKEDSKGSKGSRCTLCNKKSKEEICSACIAKIKGNKSEVQRAIGING